MTIATGIPNKSNTASAAASPGRVLILDDDEFMLRTLTGALHVIGHRDVVATRHAANALAVVRDPAKRIGLILCDLNLPDIDGIEFLRTLAQEGYRGCLVLISGEGTRTLKLAEDLAVARRLDVLGSLVKPVHASILASYVHEWKLRRAVPPRATTSQSVSADELRAAIASGAITAHFQPQVRLRDRKVVGVEALARWEHPSGMILPNVFIPVAEEAGLIGPLARRVASYALKQSAGWRRRDILLRMALNASMDNLKDLQFPAALFNAIEEADVPSSSVLVEVTETRFMADPIASRDTLARLRLKKIGLSIDDFGTGYASLAQLRDLPFCELKIDRSFVRNAAFDAAALAILEACVALGKKLSMTLVAEGVETQEDWDRVKAMGCDIAQGYLIAKPMPADEVPDWVLNWR
ncbi:MAG TPA: EAL domain-containing response regulator [Burkholderiaceae bacterium]|jgi:EAL domain-containing protein (putative c-di-GMP-specific phosphodiesterase class I)/FixJ family two-component response regulator|nr:EAL domain-containing response regulator [Burkholderiaceae bacterium]